MILSLLACSLSLSSDEGHLAIEFPEISSLVADQPLFLVGTTTCPRLTCEGDSCPSDTPSADEVGACYAQSADHASIADGCITFAEVGPLLWTFAPLGTCPYVALPDTLTAEVVGPDEVSGAFESVLEGFVEAGVAGGTVRAAYPEDWKIVPGEPLRAVEGGAGELYVTVRRGEDLVAYSAGSTPWVVRSGTGEEAVLPTEGVVHLSELGGVDSTVSMRTPAGDVVIGEVQFVPASEAVSLEIVVAYAITSEDASTEVPLGARVLVRDADGRLLLGAPVVWTSDLLVWSEDAELPDYLLFGDRCTSPALEVGPQHGTLTATLGTLTTTVDIDFTPRTEPEDDSDWSAPAACGVDEDTGKAGAPQGCGCAAGVSPPGWLGLVGLLALRRRR